MDNETWNRKAQQTMTSSYDTLETIIPDYECTTRIEPPVIDFIKNKTYVAIKHTYILPEHPKQIIFEFKSCTIL